MAGSLEEPGGGKPFRRWTADTERAFLLALRLTGQVKLAAAEIGRTAGGAYERRKRSPDFDRAWTAVLAARQHACALPGDAAERRPLNRVRCDGWTGPRRRRFLRALAETGVTREACARARISTTAAYRLRARSPEFARAWDEAAARGAPTPEEAAYARAVEGWEEPIVQGGRVVATRRRYSDTLLRALLHGAGGPATKPMAGERASGKSARPRATDEETNAALKKSLDGLAIRLKRERRERDLAWADEMVARGLAP